MTAFLPRAIVLLILLALPVLPLGAQEAGSHGLTEEQRAHRRTLFQKVFGPSVLMEPVRVGQALKARPGTRIPVDRNGDGQTDELYYVDVDRRHQPEFQPLLVHVIDEDGDMGKTGEGDRDNDLYAWAWNGMPEVATVVDYADEDGDGDVDQMGLYYFSPNDHFTGSDTLRVWWSRDVGDDDFLWYHLNGQYQQWESQWRTHFSGDEIFVAMAFDEKAETFVPVWENPFAFYDPDRDGNSEIVLRISGRAEAVQYLRYSFDADNDTVGENVHDYDFGFTALSGGKVRLTPEFTRTEKLRGAETGPYLDWSKARGFAEGGGWAAVLFVWDENDNNVEEYRSNLSDPEERWEGVIASKCDGFPQVGGPPCGVLNKRYELDRDNSGRMRLYWSPIDRRIHMAGAESSSLAIDQNLDGKADATFLARDNDGDGLLDAWEIDADADGKADRTFHDPKPAVVWLSSEKPGDGNLLDYSRLVEFYRARLAETVKTYEEIVAAIEPPKGAAEPLSFFQSGLASYREAHGVGAKMQASLECRRLYLELAIERWLASGVDEKLVGTWSAGNLAGMNPAPRAEEGALQIVAPQEHWRVVCLRRGAEGFPTDLKKGCARFANLPAQADDLDGDGTVDEIAVALPAGACLPVRGLFANVDGKAPQKAVDGRLEWLAGLDKNVGWESERCAYRLYDGCLDFFGKQYRSPLILASLKEESYHNEQKWGMDVFHVGKSAGLGGLSLWEGKKEIVCRNPAGEGSLRFERKILASGPLRAVVEVTTMGIVTSEGPVEIRTRYSIVAGHRETEAESEVLLEGRPVPQESGLRLGIGLTRIPGESVLWEPKEGFLGAWGAQDPIVIQEIGLGVVIDPSRIGTLEETRTDRVLVTKEAPSKPIRYVLAGGWRKGERFPFCFGAGHWGNVLRELARGFRNPPSIEAVKR